MLLLLSVRRLHSAGGGCVCPLLHAGPVCPQSEAPAPRTCACQGGLTSPFEHKDHVSKLSKRELPQAFSGPAVLDRQNPALKTEIKVALHFPLLVFCLSRFVYLQPTPTHLSPTHSTAVAIFYFLCSSGAPSVASQPSTAIAIADETFTLHETPLCASHRCTSLARSQPGKRSERSSSFAPFRCSSFYRSFSSLLKSKTGSSAAVAPA